MYTKRFLRALKRSMPVLSLGLSLAQIANAGTFLNQSLEKAKEIENRLIKEKTTSKQIEILKAFKKELQLTLERASTGIPIADEYQVTVLHDGLRLFLKQKFDRTKCEKNEYETELVFRFEPQCENLKPTQAAVIQIFRFLDILCGRPLTPSN